MITFEKVKTQRQQQEFFDTIRTVAAWARKKDPTMWTVEHLSEERFFTDYNKDELYLVYVDDEPAVTAVLAELDEEVWSEKGLDSTSIYIHKISVNRKFSKMNLLTKLFEFSNDLAVQKGKKFLRLDCANTREKVVELYQKNGFKIVHEENIYNSGICHTVFFEKDVIY